MSTAAFDRAPFGAASFVGKMRENIFRVRLAMAFFLAAETMFFAGLVSAHVVLSASAPSWPPAGQPRLPVELTGFNTLLLLWSGVALFLASRLRARDPGKKEAVVWLALANLGGLGFLFLQGREWVELVGFGFAATGSLYAATFYALIGVHALHVAAGAAALTALLVKAARGRGGDDAFFAGASLYWYFVVAVWPILYATVYLR